MFLVNEDGTTTKRNCKREINSNQIMVNYTTTAHGIPIPNYTSERRKRKSKRNAKNNAKAKQNTENKK